MSADPPATLLAAQLAELRREMKQRERVFPRWVADGKLTQAASDTRMAALRGAIRTIEACQAGLPPPPDPTAQPQPTKQGDLLNG